MAQKKLNWTQLSVAGTKDEFLGSLYSALKEVDWQPMISDVLANRNRGSERALELLERHCGEDALAGRPQTLWTLYVMRDERGQKMRPGDKIVLRTRKARPVDESGRALDARQIRGLTVQGRDHLLYDTTELTIDEKGCVRVGYHNAVRMLVNNGVVGRFVINGSDVRVETIAPIAGCREVSRGVVTFKDGHVGPAWHWLYCEVDDETYARLPAATSAAPEEKRYQKR